MKHVKKFDTYEDYQSYVGSGNFIQPNVSKCINTNETYCTMLNTTYKITPLKAKLLDILYSDNNGNLSYTSEVLPASEGKTPIALCIAGTGFFGDNEPARWMSLKYMSCTTPETGSLTSQGIYWGNYGNNITTIDDIKTTYNGGSDLGYLTANWITRTDNKIPTLFTENNEWNTSVLGTVNQYAVTDIDGKNKTDKILDTATAQATWRTDTSITNLSATNYAPAACCCARYHTLGTKVGDWYLGACGEISTIIVKRDEINTKLALINAIYPNNCASSLTNDSYCTSTEYMDATAYCASTNNGIIGSRAKNLNGPVIAMLQY